MVEHYRQGDILFRRVQKLPESVKRKTDNIVALGEVTGHKHMVSHGNLFDGDFGMFVESDGLTEIVHDEHGPITLPQGVFEVVRQREYVAPKIAPRPVRD